MLFVIDIGNTNIVLSLMKSVSEYVFEDRTETIKTEKAGHYTKVIKSIFEKNNLDPTRISGAIISSVVPEVTEELKKASDSVTGKDTLILSVDLNIGIEIKEDNPHQVGADLVAGAVGGIVEYEGPLAIFDLGTATTLTVVTKEKELTGALIMPGVKISLEAMVSRASQLPKFDLVEPGHLIGKNTIEAMQSGIINGNAAMIDGLIERTEAELGQKVTAIMTGGLGTLIAPYCRRQIIYEPDLVLKGLWYIFEMNRG